MQYRRKMQRNVEICISLIDLYITYCPPPFANAENIKTHLFVCPFVRLSVTKTLTWLISSEVLMIKHWYLSCIIFMISPFYWYHAVTLTLTYFKDKLVAEWRTKILRICLLTSVFVWFGFSIWRGNFHQKRRRAQMTLSNSWRNSLLT